MRLQKMRLQKWFLPTLLILALVACASFINTSYVTLNESKDFYTIAMSSAASLQTQGLITLAQRDEINKVAKIYKEAHNLAVDALSAYKTTSLAADKDKVIIAIAQAASRWEAVAALINAIKPGLVPATLSK